MRRAAVLILLLALLGASTSLGVAWFIGGVQPEWAAWDDVLDERIGDWSVVCYVGRGQRTRSGDGGPIGDAQSIRAAPRGSVFARPPIDEEDRAVEIEFGWPALAWRAVWRPHPSEYGSLWRGDVHGGIYAGPIAGTASTLSGERVLPLRPIWFGVVIASAFWMIPWIGVTVAMIGLGEVRRRRQLRRDRCAICGYDLRGSDALLCSECGSPRGARRPMLGNRLFASIAAVLALLLIGLFAVGAKVGDLRHGPHALHLAARDGDLRAIKRHLANGVNVDVLVDPNHDAAGTTPLIWAMAGGQIEAVELLLDRGAAPGAKDADGRSALALAVAQADDRLLTAMLKAGADPNQRVWMSMTPLEYVIGRDRSVQCARVLIDAGADVNHSETDGAPLTTAARRNDVAVARLLIAAGAHLNAPVENLPIVSAVRRGSDEMSRLLIESGAEIARAELDLLRLAVESGNTELVTLLLVHGAPRAVVGEAATPLHVAVARCDTDMVRFLTASGFDPTVSDEHGRTPFEQAIEASLVASGYDEIVEILHAAVRAWYRDRGEDDGG